MKKILLILFLFIPSMSFAAILSTTNWEFNTSSTANMLNGGGFNYANANFLTDGSWTSANTTAPALSSVTYSFKASDVGNWIYSSNTTNPGFYKISSVTTGVATVNATIGQGVILNASTNRWVPSTIVGVDSSASVSSKTFGVDYSQSTTAIVNGITDFTAVGASTTMTSATAGFTPVMVGNIFHQTTTGTGAFGVVGWYEIVSYVNATTVVLDRTENSGTASVGCTGYIGGSLDLAGALQSTFFTQLVGGNFVFVHSGSYTLGTSSTATGTGSSSTTPSYIIGYNSVRGDSLATSNTNWPFITCAANTITFAAAQQLQNMSITGTGATVLTMGTSGSTSNLKVTNTSTTAARVAIATGTSTTNDNIEAVSQNGSAISLASASSVNGFYTHDSNICVNVGATGSQALSNGICSSFTTTGINGSNGNSMMMPGENLTIYGSQAKVGSGIVLLNANIKWFIKNSIIYGTTLGLSQGTAQQASNIGSYNDFFNNTTDTTFWTKDVTDIALDPQFTNVSEVTGTAGAALASSKFQDSTKNFTSLGVVANQDYLHVVSGTATAGIYLITAISTTTNPNDTLTLNNTAGSGATTNVVYNIPIGHNFTPGSNMKGKGFPGSMGNGLNVSYSYIGAIEPNSTGGGTAIGVIQ